MYMYGRQSVLVQAKADCVREAHPHQRQTASAPPSSAAWAGSAPPPTSPLPVTHAMHMQSGINYREGRCVRA